ncbi:MAG: hypothetical protein ACRC37_08215 [Lentisphaeria bacterium]
MKFIVYLSFALAAFFSYSQDKPYSKRILKMITDNEIKYSQSEQQLLNSIFKGEKKSEYEILNLIENKDLTFNKGVISDFISFILEQDLNNQSNLVYINKFVEKYHELPCIIGFYLWPEWKLQDKAPDFWLEPCMNVFVRSVLMSEKDFLFGELRTDLNSSILIWCAQNKDIGKFKYFILNYPFFERSFFSVLEEFGVNYSMSKDILFIKEGENYESLFDWYYKKIIIPASLDKEWFEALQKRENRIKDALKSTSSFTDKQKYLK